jgi:hypothetical protein
MRNKGYFILLFTLTACRYNPDEDIKNTCSCYDKAFTKKTSMERLYKTAAEKINAVSLQLKKCELLRIKIIDQLQPDRLKIEEAVTKMEDCYSDAENAFLHKAK